MNLPESIEFGALECCPEFTIYRALLEDKLKLELRAVVRWAARRASFGTFFRQII